MPRWPSLRVGAAALLLAMVCGLAPTHAQEDPGMATELAALHFALSTVIADVRRTDEAALRELRKRHAELQAAVRAGKLDAAAARTELAALQAQAEQLRERIAQQDREWAREYRAQRLRLQRLQAMGTTTDEGRAALASFEDGNEPEALRAFDALAAARKAARQPARAQEDASDPETDRSLAAENQRARDRRRNVEDAVDLRDIAHLALQAQRRGKAGYAAVLARFQAVVALDPTEARDSIELARLHRQAGDARAMRQAAEQAMRYALPEADQALALSELGFTLRQGGALKEARPPLERALALRRQQLAAEPDKRDLERYLSVAQERLGELALDEGRFASAADHFGRCLELRRKLAAGNDAPPQAQRDLSVALGHVARTRLAQGDVAAAAQAAQEASRLADQGWGRDEAESLRDRAVFQALEGDLALLAGRPDEAGRLYADSTASRQRALTRDPGSPRALRDLAVAHARQGDLQAFKGDARAALAHYDEAGRWLERSRDAVSDDRTALRREQVALLVQRGRVLADEPGPDAARNAMALFGQALSWLRDIDRQAPEQYTVRRDIANVNVRIAEILLRTTGPRLKADALQAHTYLDEALRLRAAALDKEPASRTLRVAVWDTLNRLGLAYMRLDDSARAHRVKQDALGELRRLPGGSRALEGVPDASDMLLNAALLAESLADLSYAEGLKPVTTDMRQRKLLSAGHDARLEALQRRSR